MPLGEVLVALLSFVELTLTCCLSLQAELRHRSQGPFCEQDRLGLKVAVENNTRLGIFLNDPPVIERSDATMTLNQLVFS